MSPAVSDPVLTPGGMTAHVAGIPLALRAPLWWRVAFIVALLLLGLLGVAVGWLFYAGVGIWGISWPVAWGLAIVNYVWWIGIASGGTLISALFFLLRAEWRTPLNRIAESMTVFAAACAGIFPILHLGRPWFFYWLFPYPDTMGLWPQFRSPLLWDFFAILTYVVSSVLFWYLGLIPDCATLRDRATRRWQAVLYGVLALGFRGTGRQWRQYRATYGVLAAIMAPLVISVHSIVGLDFAGAQTGGWHSTQFPPFFVFGAALSGLAAVLLLVMPLRRLLRLEPFITPYHLDVLAKLLLTSSLLVAYAYGMDAFSVFYGGEPGERVMFLDRVAVAGASLYWCTIAFNCAAPLLLLHPRWRRSEVVLMAVALLAVVGMWLERYGIVVASLHRTRMPSAWGDYHPTFWDWACLAGSVGLFLAGFLLFVRRLPAITIFEMREALARRAP